MPRKLALEPCNLHKKVEGLMERYGSNIMRRASNLYNYCYSDFHSYEISRAKKIKGKLDLPSPFMQKGRREYAMVYTFLLSKILRKKHKNYIEDAIFIIYFTYLTGFHCTLWDELSYKELSTLLDETGGMAKDDFKLAFKKISKYKFGKTGYVPLKRIIVERNKSFKRKYSNDEQVEMFCKKSLKIIKNGL